MSEESLKTKVENDFLNEIEHMQKKLPKIEISLIDVDGLPTEPIEQEPNLIYIFFTLHCFNL